MIAMRCLIIDDEPLARKLIRVYLEEVKEIRVVGECNNALQAKSELKGNGVDLVFLDIQMPGMTGVELVQGLERPPIVIFTTAYEHYAVKAFELDVADYLVKPYSQERFKKASERAVEIFSQQRGMSKGEKKFIFLKTAYQLTKFYLDDILYVEGMKEYVKIQSINGDTSLVYIRMKEMEEKLGEKFMRVHKSFIVNMDKADALGTNELVVDKKKIPLGKVYKKAVLAYFT